ncbi:MAG: exbD [Chlamydiales bacterium]|jgi:biopolymer transport protein ExbD|nr:exbD [Chlamydiales bacterium]
MLNFKTKLKFESRLIDLTPLVDVIFLLMIFFILTSDLLPLKSLNIENPRLNKVSSPLTTQILVVMDAQHVIYIGHKKEIFDLTMVKEALLNEINNLKKGHDEITPSVVLSVDRRAEYGYFLKLFSIAQECSPNLRLVYKSEEDKIT